MPSRHLHNPHLQTRTPRVPSQVPCRHHRHLQTLAMLWHLNLHPMLRNRDLIRPRLQRRGCLSGHCSRKVGSTCKGHWHLERGWQSQRQLLLGHWEQKLKQEELLPHRRLLMDRLHPPINHGSSRKVESTRKGHWQLERRWQRHRQLLVGHREQKSKQKELLPQRRLLMDRLKTTFLETLVIMVGTVGTLRTTGAVGISAARSQMSLLMTMVDVVNLSKTRTGSYS